MIPRVPSLAPRALTVPATTGWGVALAAVAALISGIAIWLNGFAVRQVPDPAVYTALKNGVAAAVLLALVGAATPRADTGLRDPKGRLALTFVGLIGGGVAFLLFFSGLAMAIAPSAAFIQKTMFVWVAVLAVPFLGERLGSVQLVALAALAAGQVLLQPPRGVTWGTGETLILLATLCWAVEVVVVRRYLRVVTAPVLGAGRLGIGLIVIVGFLIATGRWPGVLALTATGWAWVIATGVILACYASTWFAALRRAPATTVTSVLVGGAVVTGVLQAVANAGRPTIESIGGYLLITGAVALLARIALRSGRQQAAGTLPVAARVDA
jgi:drug/metabolite transporter (DMT)-like permease